MRIRSFIGFALLASAPHTVAAAESDADKGKAIVSQHCARCHAIGPDGASTHPKAPPFRDVVTRYPLDNLEEALAEGIMSGHPDMPEFEFKTSEIAEILAYFQLLKPVPPPPEAAPPAKP